MEEKCLYDRNKTMELLGMQTSPVCFNDDVRKAVEDVLTAHEKYVDILLISDIFNLGVIYGKRDLRTKKGGGQYYNLLGAYCHKALQQISNSRVKSLD